MPLGTPIPPAGGAGYTPGGKTAGYTVPKGGSLSAQQQAAQGFLQGASQLNYLDYSNQLSALGAQRSAAYAAASAAAGAANRGYGLTIRGIDEDLMYGNQLREQEQYRNVDLGRERSGVDLGNANAVWQIIMNDLAGRRNFAFQDLYLGRDKTNLQYNTGMRETGSDAIARGARTAAGTLARFGDVRSQRDLGLRDVTLGFDKTIQGLDTEYKRGEQANKYANQQYSIDMKTFDSIAQTYGIQAAQAAAQAALAKDRASADRSAAGSAAAAQRQAALAGLSGSASRAYTNFMQNELALAQQALTFR